MSTTNNRLVRSLAGFRNVSTPAVCGVIVGGITEASPFGFWWLPAATVYAMGLTLIAAVYIGFSVADGSWKVIAVETGVDTVFVVIAATVAGPGWLRVVGLTGHGLKDLWQHRTHFVANTRWWPPFCVTVDRVAAAWDLGGRDLLPCGTGLSQRTLAL